MTNVTFQSIMGGGVCVCQRILKKYIVEKDQKTSNYYRATENTGRGGGDLV